MNDQEIIALYFARDEKASDETYRKFGGYAYTIANNILGCPQDAEELVNDLLVRLWERIPPAKPENLYAYIAAAARNLARTRYAAQHTQKRGSGQTELALDELRDCIGTPDSVECAVESHELAETLNRFLATLNPLHRKIFVQRYWYMSPVEDIAADLEIGKSRVTVSLMRTRKKLRDYLTKEGYL